MSHSQDYYHSSSRTSKRSEGHDYKREERLPSLHHVVGDALTRPSAYDFHAVKSSLPNVRHAPHYSHDYGYDEHEYPQRGPTLPPIYPGSSSSHAIHSSHHSGSTHSSTTRYPSHHTGTQHASTSSRARTNADYPSNHDHTFQAFYPSRTGDLVTVSTSHQPTGIIRISDLPDDGDDDPRKKHKCAQCGRRFDRPSGLETHMLKHTGETPHVCPVHGCGKVFNVKSNMTRHVRTQHAGESEEHDGRGSSRYSTYSAASHGSSGDSSPPSTSYYSSRRH